MFFSLFHLTENLIIEKSNLMKKTVFIALFVFLFSCSASTNAQNADTAQSQNEDKETTTLQDVKEDVKEGAQEIKDAGKTVGNKTAEIAVKGAAKLTDKQLKNKTGPDGQTIYEDKYKNYYYVNDKGRKIYLKHNALKDK